MIGWLLADWIANLEGRREVVRPPQRLAGPVAVLLALTMAFVAAVWLESRFGTRIFLMRYLFLTSVAWILAVGCACGQVFERLWGPRDESAFLPDAVPTDTPHDGRRWRLLGRAFVCLCVASLALATIAHLVHGRTVVVLEMLSEDLTAARQYPDCPILTTDDHDFICLCFYIRAEKRVYLLTDEWYTGTPTGFQIGAALERNYFPDSMRTLARFLANHDRFLIVDAKGLVSESLARDAGWEGRKVSERIWLWQRPRRNEAAPAGDRRRVPGEPLGHSRFEEPGRPGPRDPALEIGMATRRHGLI